MLLACAAALPERVERIPDEPPLAPWFGIGRTDQLLATADGMFATTNFGTLWITDTSTEFIGFGGFLLADGGNGVLRLESPDGDQGYDYRNRRDVDAPSVPVTSTASLEGDTLVLPEGRLELNLPPQTWAWVAEEGTDGRVRVGVTRRYSVFGGNEEPDKRPTSLVTIQRSPPTILSRVDIPVVAEYPWGGLGDVRTVAGTTWAVVDNTAGTVDAGGFHPAPDLGWIAALTVDPSGRLWAAGDGIWRRTDDVWEEVRHPNLREIPSVRFEAWLDGGMWHGGARPAMNAALLVDGDRQCGDATDPVPFLLVWGDCSGWLGFAADGRVWAGDATSRHEISAPVGEVVDVARRGDVVVVLGTEAVGWYSLRFGGRWTRVPVRGGQRVDAWGGEANLEVWVSTDDGVCHTRGGPLVCAPLGSGPPIAAGPGVAWTLADGGVVEIVPGAAPRALTLPESAWPWSVVYDEAHDRVWAVGETGLYVVDRRTGASRQVEGAHGHGAGLVVGDELRFAAGVGLVARFRVMPPG